MNLNEPEVEIKHTGQSRSRDIEEEVVAPNFLLVISGQSDCRPVDDLRL